MNQLLFVPAIKYHTPKQLIDVIEGRVFLGGLMVLGGESKMAWQRVSRARSVQITSSTRNMEQRDPTGMW